MRDGVRVDYKRTLFAIDNDGDTFNSRAFSRFNGGGLGIGFGGHYSICGNFGIGSTFNFIALIGETLFNFSASDEDTGINAHFARSKGWDHVIPGFEFRLGIDYAFCLCKFDFTVEVGYELDWYSDLLFYPSHNLPAPEMSARIPTTDCQSIGFAGPFFRLTAAF